MYHRDIIAPGERIHTFSKTAEWPLQASKIQIEDIEPFPGNMFDAEFFINLSVEEQITGIDADELQFMLFGEKIGDSDTKFRLMPTTE